MDLMYYSDGEEIKIGDLVSARYDDDKTLGLTLGILAGSLGIVKDFGKAKAFNVQVYWINKKKIWMLTDELKLVRRDAEKLMTWL